MLPRKKSILFIIIIWSNNQKLVCQSVYVVCWKRNLHMKGINPEWYYRNKQHQGREKMLAKLQNMFRCVFFLKVNRKVWHKVVIRWVLAKARTEGVKGRVVNWTLCPLSSFWRMKNLDIRFGSTWRRDAFSGSLLTFDKFDELERISLPIFPKYVFL